MLGANSQHEPGQAESAKMLTKMTRTGMEEWFAFRWRHHARRRKGVPVPSIEVLRRFRMGKMAHFTGRFSSVFQPSRSITVALAWPPPSHMVWKPNRPSVASRWFKSVPIKRTPLAPSGADGDGSTARVEPGRVVLEGLAPHQGDGGERFVAFDGVEFVHLHA